MYDEQEKDHEEENGEEVRTTILNTTSSTR